MRAIVKHAWWQNLGGSALASSGRLMVRWIRARALFATMPSYALRFRSTWAHNREGLAWVAKLTPGDARQNEGHARLKAKFSV